MFSRCTADFIINRKYFANVSFLNINFCCKIVIFPCQTNVNVYVVFTLRYSYFVTFFLTIKYTFTIEDFHSPMISTEFDDFECIS